VQPKAAWHLATVTRGHHLQSLIMHCSSRIWMQTLWDSGAKVNHLPCHVLREHLTEWNRAASGSYQGHIQCWTASGDDQAPISVCPLVLPPSKHWPCNMDVSCRAIIMAAWPQCRGDFCWPYMLTNSSHPSLAWWKHEWRGGGQVFTQQIDLDLFDTFDSAVAI